MYVVYERMGFMEAKLPEAKFVRIHKSFIIAVDKVYSYSNECIKINNQKIPIGRMYKQGFLSRVL